MDATAIIEALGLEPHPEGGFYAETYRATEAIHFYLGDPVTLCAAWPAFADRIRALSTRSKTAEGGDTP